MTQRPFRDRPVPELNADFPTAIPALLSECQEELAIITSLSALNVEEVAKQGRGKLDALKTQYLTEGRYSEEFLERRRDLSLYLFQLFKVKRAWLKELRTVRTASLSGALLAERKQKMAWWNEGEGDRWPLFQRIDYDLDHLDPNNVETTGGHSDDRAPDNISDGLSQGIGVRKYL